jgi:BirA family biotin operon repressor/biotin-[acetyl-CoA-carboxylase] ligase
MSCPTLFIGKSIVQLAQVDSTNLYASRLLKESHPAEGTLINTEEQTAGRGQRDTQWSSEKGKNLTFSIILYPAFLPASRQFLLSKVIALGMADFLSGIVSKPLLIRIKWPNDIYAGDKKLGGILIENTLDGAIIKSSVVGIGLNINQKIFEKTLNNPISLKMLEGKPFAPEVILCGICQSIESYYLQLRDKHISQIDAAYNKFLYRKDQWCNYSLNGNSLKGCIKEVKMDGTLILEAKTNLSEESKVIIISEVKELVYL